MQCLVNGHSSVKTVKLLLKLNKLVKLILAEAFYQTVAHDDTW